MKIKLASIEMDVSIQCRAMIDTGVVNDYAERMEEGDQFPNVVLFGTADKCWIADGWHRVLASKQVGYLEINAELRTGGRADALKFALSANAVHGHRRSNADKRRAVEIALREFANLSSRQIAELCGVSDMLVGSIRPQLQESCSSTRLGADGKERRLPQPRQAELEQQADESPVQQSIVKPNQGEVVEQPIAVGMQMANAAIDQLRKIDANDSERLDALNAVQKFIATSLHEKPVLSKAVKPSVLSRRAWSMNPKRRCEAIQNEIKELIFALRGCTNHPGYPEAIARIKKAVEGLG